MGDLLLKCPLCCSEVFDSKELLVDHLSKIWFNLRCPACNDECSSLAHLIEHLNSEACVPKSKSDHNSGVLTTTQIEPEECQTLNHQNVTDNQEDHNIIDQSQVTEVSDVSRMYVELLSKQLAKPCLQTQELKLVKEDDMKVEPDPLLPEVDPEENQEIYSCNTLAIQPMQTEQLVFKQEVTKPNRLAEKRVVQVDSVVRNIKNDIKKGPYHKVIVKEMQTLEGGKKVKVYNCMTCNIYVTSLDEFKSHPCKPLKYQCLHCPVAYENSKSLSAHMKVHKSHTESETDNSGPFRCDICSTVFPSNKSLKLHKRMHDPVKARPIELPVETEGSEPSNDKFLCSICDKLIPIDYRAVHHNSHKTDNKFNCDICNRKFHSSEYLEMHMSVHNIDKAFKTSVQLAGHKNSHTKPFSCQHCNRPFASLYAVRAHTETHARQNNLKFSCNLCGASYARTFALKDHIKQINQLVINTNEAASVMIVP
ncbi:hypothetical protein MSG28_013270 [Choristoneura fumiferana]|uniref:Uncharacterized protein n=2 Tax=Choristoneura fumiferana TaxID=7141 RepID=A0ACC0KTX0_CHOFU|nr:hypothetical protein MSG28_013270 [Choristoneura fumiferana]KAI8439516.1 hypothetical protein MSG28_013270 [Choristoneura fumiferana]